MVQAFDSLLRLAWPHNLIAVISFSLLSSCWLRLANHNFSKSPGVRLAASLPVVAGNFVAPLLFDRGAEPVTLAFTAFLLTWLGNFKAIAAVGRRGPLAQQPWGPLQHWALYAMPIVPAEGPAAAPRRPPRSSRHTGPGTEAQMLSRLQNPPTVPSVRPLKVPNHSQAPMLASSSRWFLKAGLTAAVVFAVQQPDLPPFARSCLYVLGLYTMLGLVMDGPAALVLRPLRLRLAPHFLPPWESRSLAAFWGTHWNQAAGNALRTTVYEPIVQGKLVDGGAAAPAARRRSARLAAVAGSGGEGRRLAGMAAAFVASGAAHEVIFWYVDGSFTKNLSWLAFFSLQAPLVAGERLLLGMLRQKGLAPPEWLRVAATLGVLQVTAHWLFWLPAEEAGVAERFAASMRRTFADLAAAAAGLLA